MKFIIKINIYIKYREISVLKGEFVFVGLTRFIEHNDDDINIYGCLPKQPNKNFVTFGTFDSSLSIKYQTNQRRNK